MSKTAPLLIVIVVLIIGVGGFLFLSKQKQQTPSQEVLPSPTPIESVITPTESVIISPTNQPATQGAVMNNIVKQADGLILEDEVVGSGAEARSGDKVTVNYRGTLVNGTKFDSSYDRNQPFTTQIGVGQVIKGWDEGIVGMKVGGKRKLTIPPSLGYGNQDLGSIPPNSTLIFEVELLKVN